MIVADKYKKTETLTIKDKINRLNSHSIAKKTARLSQHIKHETGIATKVGQKALVLLQPLSYLRYNPPTWERVETTFIPRSKESAVVTDIYWLWLWSWDGNMTPRWATSWWRWMSHTRKKKNRKANSSTDSEKGFHHPFFDWFTCIYA